MDHRIVNIDPNKEYAHRFTLTPVGIVPTGLTSPGYHALGPQRMPMTPGNRMLPSQITNQKLAQELMKRVRGNQ